MNDYLQYLKYPLQSNVFFYYVKKTIINHRYFRVNVKLLYNLEKFMLFAYRMGTENSNSKYFSRFAFLYYQEF